MLTHHSYLELAELAIWRASVAQPPAIVLVMSVSVLLVEHDRPPPLLLQLPSPWKYTGPAAGRNAETATRFRLLAQTAAIKPKD